MFHGGGFPPYVSAAERKRRADRELARLRKQGRVVSPVVIDGRAIARTFWGKAWCDNLERYSDYANRLPRGRTYARNGSVVDLQIARGAVTALVNGSELYEVSVTMQRVAAPRWTAICKDCAGGIDSLVALLQGQLSEAVMGRICKEQTGLFPAPVEMAFDCSCPDAASMCKHVAATLYGVGARLDQQPELLFTLRGVEAQDLLARAARATPGSRKKPAARRVLVTDDLSALFGLDIASLPEKPRRRRAK